jgi:excisionase family DNA binding protein
MKGATTKGRSSVRPVPVESKLALSVSEVADICGISTSLVRKLVARGVLPRVPHTERVLIARTAVERWVNDEAGAA